MSTFGESLYGGTIRCHKIIATEADLPSGGGGGIIDASSININNKWEIRLDASSNFILENTAISINSITGDAHTGKITLYDYNLEDLENVTITNLANDQILQYNSTTSIWENATIPSGVTSLPQLTDVTITNLANEQILQYNEFSELWENATLPTGVTTLPQLTDVTITNLANEQLLRYNSTSSAWENIDLPSTSLPQLTDVTITNVANEQILQYNSTSSIWENATLPTGVATLNDLTDVTIANVANGQFLFYNDFNQLWENIDLPSTSLPQLTDVTITNVANEQLLRYNSTTSAWENTTPTYLDGANLPDNFLIKSVNNQAVTSHLYSTTTTTKADLQFSIPVDDIFNVVAGVIETTTNALGTSKRMNLAAGTIANTRGLTITQAGRVGIGILNPEEDLEVDGSIQIDSASTARLKFQQSGQTPHALGEIDSEQDGIDGGDLEFYTKIDNGSVTEKLRINNIGAVGIGGANYGTQGQVLTSNGSGSAISWSSPSGGVPNGTNQSQGLHWNNTTSQWEITGDGKLAFGNDAGEINQGFEAIAIGTNAGETNQGTYAIALGAGAGFTGQLTEAIAIGNNSGVNGQGERSIAIGLQSGASAQSADSVAIGYFAGNQQQGIKSISIGQGAGRASQNTKSVAIGNDAAGASQGSEAIAIGNNAGYGGQGSQSVAIGDRAGSSAQGTLCVAIGNISGFNTQGTRGVAIGNAAGNFQQSNNAVAVGANAGNTAQGVSSVAVGSGAAFNTQGREGVAIGNNAGYASQGNYAIAIGDHAAITSQGEFSIAIGRNAGRSAQVTESIILNATGSDVPAPNTGFYVAPIRYGVETNTLCYNTSSKEIRYEPDPARTHYNEKTMAGQVTTEFFSINRDVVRSLVLEVRIVTGSQNGYTSLYHTRTGAYFTATEIFVRNTEVIANTSFTGGGSAHVIQITENPQNAQLDINVISNTTATNTVAVYLNVFSSNGSPPVIII